MAALRNPRTGGWLAQDLRIARSPWAKGIGLLGRKSMAPGEGLYLAPCNSIHSLFMAFPFDAVFVDKNWRVVHLMPAMRPFRLSPIVWRSHGVIELPAGVIAATRTLTGDVLELVQD